MTNITYYGHACFRIEHNGTNILFDPFISGNEAAKHIDLATIPADYILLSHGHEDHVLDVEAIAKRTNATIISNFEIVSWFQKKSLQNGQPMNHGGCRSFDFGTVKYVSAVHTSSMPDGSYGGQPGGFVLCLNNGPCIYYSGDTALTYDMKLIGDQFTLDCALLCMGDVFTMGVDDAVRAAEFVGADRIIGMHYDTFPPIQMDKALARRKFDEAGRDLVLMDIGETRALSHLMKKAA